MWNSYFFVRHHFEQNTGDTLFFRENKIHSNRKRQDFLDNKISNITGGRKLKVRKKQKANFFS